MLNDDKTIESTLTKEEVDKVIKQDIEYNEALETLERMNWNYVNYGSFHTPKPNFARRSTDNERS